VIGVVETRPLIPLTVNSAVGTVLCAMLACPGIQS
jgi:hypothetical protein